MSKLHQHPAAVRSHFNIPALMCTCALLASDASGSGAASGWSMLQHDAQRTGRTTAVVSDEAVRIWSVFIGNDPYRRGAPVIGPAGTVYAPNRVVVGADGVPQPLAIGSSDQGAPAVRQDGELFILDERLKRVDPATGTLLCERPGIPRFALALDSEGYVYYLDAGIGSGQVRKLTPDCTDVWAYPLINGGTSEVALGLDGGVHIAVRFGGAKFDGETGEELWNVPTAGPAGPPVVGPDGTIYHTVKPDMLLALNPDGSARWTHVFSDPGFEVDANELDTDQPDTGSPAVGPDGTVYVPGLYLNQRPALVAVDPDRNESWMYVSTELHWLAPSPVIDGAGRIFSPAGGYVAALSATDGSELWQLDAGEGDSVRTSCAIGEDGTLYATTENGFLIAFGEGCPENVLLKVPYSFREVARAGQNIDGLVLEHFHDVAIDPSGLASFTADTTGGSNYAALTEQMGGTFDMVAVGTVVDGLEIAWPEMPRRDSSGTEYLLASTAELGRVVFVDREVFLQEQSAPQQLAPVVIDSFFSPSDRYIDHDQLGRFLVHGTPVGGDWPGLLLVNTQTQSVTPLVTQYDVVDGFSVEHINPSRFQSLGDDGVVVFGM